MQGEEQTSVFQAAPSQNIFYSKDLPTLSEYRWTDEHTDSGVLGNGG